MLHTIQSLVQQPVVAPRPTPVTGSPLARVPFGAEGSIGSLGALAAAALVASAPGRGLRATTGSTAAATAAVAAAAAGTSAVSAVSAASDPAPAPAPGEADLARCLVQMLDEIDYGLLLVGADAQVHYLNHAARQELDGSHPLQRLGRTLRTASARDVSPLHAALAAAQRGLRRLLTLGEGEQRISVSVVPLPLGADGERQTLLVLGKRRMCGQLAVEAYGRSVGLTPAEVRVLVLLCEGVEPGDVALRHGVKISTVRAQIGSIRTKTGAASIRDLVRQVAVLPPLVGALRTAA